MRQRSSYDQWDLLDFYSYVPVGVQVLKLQLLLCTSLALDDAWDSTGPDFGGPLAVLDPLYSYAPAGVQVLKLLLRRTTFVY